MALSHLSTNKTATLLPNKPLSSVSQSASYSSSASNQITYPYSPRKFLWAQRLISSDKVYKKVDEIAKILINDLSQNTLPYGPKTCKLVGRVIGSIHKIYDMNKLKICETLLLNELATQDSFPQYKKLYDTIWNEIQKNRGFATIELYKERTHSEFDKKLLDVSRVQKDPYLRNNIKIHSSVPSPENWLKEMLTLIKTQFLSSEYLNDLIRQLANLIMNNCNILTTEMCKDIGRIINQICTYEKNEILPYSTTLFILLLVEEKNEEEEKKGPPNLERKKRPEYMFDTIWEIIRSNSYPSISSCYSHESFHLTEISEHLLDLPRVKNDQAFFHALDAFYARSIEEKPITEILQHFGPYLTKCPKINKLIMVRLLSRYNQQMREPENFNLSEYIQNYLDILTHIAGDINDVITLAQLLPLTKKVEIDWFVYGNFNEKLSLLKYSLSSLKNITSFRIYGDYSNHTNKEKTLIIPSICEFLEKFPNITELSLCLENLENCNEFGPIIATMTNLTHLDLSGSSFTNAIAPSLNNLTKLKSLNLKNTKTTLDILTLINPDISKNLDNFVLETDAPNPPKTKNVETKSVKSPVWPLETATHHSRRWKIERRNINEFSIYKYLKQFNYNLSDDSFFALGNIISNLDTTSNISCRRFFILKILQDELEGKTDPSVFDKLWENIHLSTDFNKKRNKGSRPYSEYPDHMERFLAMSRVQNNPELLVALDGYIAKYELYIICEYLKKLNQTDSSSTDSTKNDSYINVILDNSLERYGPHLHNCPQIYARINLLIQIYLTYYTTEANTSAIYELLDKHKSVLNTLQCNYLPWSHDVLDTMSSQLPNLEKAVLVGKFLPRNEPLKPLLKLNGLTSLTFICSETDFDDIQQVLTDLNQLILNNPNLKELNCNIPAIPESFYDSISKLKDLTHLQLNCKDVTNEIGPTLSKLRNLETLNLLNTRVTDGVLEAIKPAFQPKLEELYLKN